MPRISRKIAALPIHRQKNSSGNRTERHGKNYGPFSPNSAGRDIDNSSPSRGLQQVGGGVHQVNQRGAPERHEQRHPEVYYYTRASEAGSSAPPVPPKSQLKNNKKMPARYTIPAGKQNGNTMASDLAIYSYQVVPADATSPSYWVEHLITFGIGDQFRLNTPDDGVRKLQQMERRSAVWAQPMVLRLTESHVIAEDENGDLVEQFPIELLSQPTAYVTPDPREAFNNVLMFVMREDPDEQLRHGRGTQQSSAAAEMHMFQCNRVSAAEVASDLQLCMSGRYGEVPPGRRDTGFVVTANLVVDSGPGNSRDTGRKNEREKTGKPPRHAPRDASDVDTSDTGENYLEPQVNELPDANDMDAVQGFDEIDLNDPFQRDVNTMNRCFDDIEKFVARLRSAASAQRELDQLNEKVARGNKQMRAAIARQRGILTMRAKLPSEAEFADILAKFKLCFNLLAVLKDVIHEPNAPELIHFLFPSLMLVLDALEWGLRKNLAPHIISPLLTTDAVTLMENSLTSTEINVWHSLGEAWCTPVERWRAALPQPYQPVFADGSAPYGRPGEQNSIAVDDEPFDDVVMAPEQSKYQQQAPPEFGGRSYNSERIVPPEKPYADESIGHRPPARQGAGASVPDLTNVPSDNADTPLNFHISRQRLFVNDVHYAGGKLAQVMYDRPGENKKELTVIAGEYLEVLNDTKNWWECRNAKNRIGFVPRNILTPINGDDIVFYNENGENYLGSIPNTMMREGYTMAKKMGGLQQNQMSRDQAMSQKSGATLQSNRMQSTVQRDVTAQGRMGLSVQGSQYQQRQQQYQTMSDNTSNHQHQRRKENIPLGTMPQQYQTRNDNVAHGTTQQQYQTRNDNISHGTIQQQYQTRNDNILHGSQQQQYQTRNDNISNGTTQQQQLRGRMIQQQVGSDDQWDAEATYQSAPQNDSRNTTRGEVQNETVLQNTRDNVNETGTNGHIKNQESYQNYTLYSQQNTNTYQTEQQNQGQRQVLQAQRFETMNGDRQYGNESEEARLQTLKKKASAYKASERQTRSDVTRETALLENEVPVRANRAAYVAETRPPRLEVHQRQFAVDTNQAGIGLHEELANTLKRRQNYGTNLPYNDDQCDMKITEHSDAQEVSEWLKAKGFSIRTLQVLEGQNGATIFALAKRQLQDFCGREEGHRLYSQLLVQKNLSGYCSRSTAELNTILDARKERSEPLNNTMANDHFNQNMARNNVTFAPDALGPNQGTARSVKNGGQWHRTTLNVHVNGLRG